MTDRDKLPVKITTGDVVVTTERSDSLVARGLEAVTKEKAKTGALVLDKQGNRREFMFQTPEQNRLQAEQLRKVGKHELAKNLDMFVPHPVLWTQV